MQHEGAGHALEQLAGQMDRRAVAAGGHVHLAGVGLGHADEILHVVNALGLGLVGVHHHHVGHGGHQGDGHKVLDGVVGQLGVQRAVDAVGAHGAHQQRVAVAGRLGHHLGTHVAARARAVVHDELLPERLGQLGRHGAGQDVGGATGRKGHHDAYGLGGPRPLGARHGGQQRRRAGQRNGAGGQGHHLATTRAEQMRSGCGIR